MREHHAFVAQWLFAARTARRVADDLRDASPDARIVHPEVEDRARAPLAEPRDDRIVCVQDQRDAWIELRDRIADATRVALTSVSSEIEIRTAVPSVFDPVRVPIAGLYNAYNALAALAVARALDIALPTAAVAIANFRPAFGRLEQVAVDGREMRLILVKNPAGFNAAIGALLETGRHPRLLAALNDRDADGRDVSWIWDADFETLAPAVEQAVVTGIRSRDLANRLKYAGVARERIEVVDAWGSAIDRAIGAAPLGGEVVVLATYTAMQALRAELARRGHVAPFWED